MTAYQAELAALSLPEFGLPRVEPAIPAVVYRERMTAFRQRMHDVRRSILWHRAEPGTPAPP